jgi:hypothetical protein
MKYLKICIYFLLPLLIFSCNKKLFLTNGETIYKTGRNLQGEKLLDKSTSRIKIVNSCKTCHGTNGDKMNSVSIKFSYLSNPNNFIIPYTDSLFFRFLDRDLKSNDTKANIGVIWKINNQDKKDLLNYLKSL